ncbi:MAG: RnfABCDGE type electron transport complex subunit B [Moraxellaceae bacterium]|nr:MAG: RnfABCDGE type electron transport complex subunit B [Moraxellaceae bacterium]
MSPAQLIPLLDAVLPQTQCGLCGHPAGCLPYATAMAQGASADGCVPGGQPVADQLAKLLGRETLPAKPSQWPIMADDRPQRIKAVIREDECIGCTKCISACPVDAILGSGKLMHSILTDLCTGCELCIPPCPVDCIDLIADPSPLPNQAERLLEQQDLRQRYQAHIVREQQQRLSQKMRKPIVAVTLSSTDIAAITGMALNPPAEVAAAASHVVTSASQTIKLAALRSQIKKLQRQLNLNPNDSSKQQQLDSLQDELQRSMDNA